MTDIKILNPVMYTNFRPVTVIENEREYHCELVSLFSGIEGNYAELRHPEKSFFCRLESFNDHQVLHELKQEEMEACQKAYADMWDVMEFEPFEALFLCLFYRYSTPISCHIFVWFWRGYPLKYTVIWAQQQAKETNMKPAVGMKVEAYKGRCIGMLIESTTWKGEIIKVNAKSIRVHITESRNMFGRREKSHWELDQVVTYRFSKTLENGNKYDKSESGLYGGIEI